MPRSTGDWHYKFGPSSLKDISKCSSKKKMEQLANCPQKDSFASVEGVWCHESTELENLRLLIDPECIEELTTLSKRDGRKYNRSIIQDQVNMCKKALGWIEELKELGENPRVIKEQLVFLHSIDGCTSTKENMSEHLITAGSMDGLIIFDDGKGIGFDHKFGKYLVEAKDNIQGKAYCSAIMEMYPEINEITFYILQPRVCNEKGKGDTYYRSELNTYRAELKSITDKADSDIINLNPGRDQCFFCTAKGICPAYKLFNKEEVKDKKGMIQLFSQHLSEEEVAECMTLDVEKLTSLTAEKLYGTTEGEIIVPIKDIKKRIKKETYKFMKPKGRNK